MHHRRVAAIGLVLGLAALLSSVPVQAQNTDELIRQVQEMGAQNDKRSVDKLIQLLSRRDLDGRVRAAIIDALASTTDEDAIDRIVRAASRGDWQFKSALMEALVKTGSEKAEEALIKHAEGRDPMVQTVAIDALGEMKSEKAVESIGKALTNARAPWQVKVAAAHALVKIGHNSGVDALIEALEDEREGRVKEEVENALYALTGKNMPTPEVWKSWWGVNKTRPLEGPGYSAMQGGAAGGEASGGGGGGGGGTVAEPTYYGIKIRSKRLVFVIDMSGSMQTELGREPNIPGPVASGGAPGAQQNKPDYSSVKTKLDLAKFELVNAIKALPPDASFNIVFYNHDVTVWKKGLVPASPGNKNDAIKRVEGLSADGLTNIYGALEEAFSLHSGKGMGGASPGEGVIVSGADYQQGADTIFFLTDGWPTTGKTLNNVTPQNGGNMQNAFAYRDEILKVVGEWLKVRKVKINTIGISESPGGHDRELMEGLAKMSGGAYVAP